MSNNRISGLSGREIAGCELIRELGSGSSGVVYLARQKRLDRLVACKLLHTENEEDQLFVKNLFSEARNAAKLDHPNVVQALDAGTTEEGINYFLMEYVDGSSLENIRLENPEKISTKFLLDLTIQLAGALDYAWEKFEMIHGDIKPGNMLVRNIDGQLKLCDLGLARSGSSENSGSEDVMITPLYAAPEIIRQEKCSADPRSDIYSFGVMVYELICGVAPFQGSLEEILEGHLKYEPEALLRKNPDMDQELAQFIEKMLKKSPEDRPASWKEVRTAFMHIRKRLYPPAVAGAAIPAGNTVQTNAAAIMDKNSSWGGIPADKKNVFARHPLLMPAILLGVIALAVAAIIVQII